MTSKNKIFKIALLVCSIILSSCIDKTNEKQTTNISEIVKKYDENNKYDVDKNITVLEKNQSIEFDVMEKKKFSMNIYDDFEKPKDFDESFFPIRIFSDYSLNTDITHLSVSLERENGKLILSPSNYLAIADIDKLSNSREIKIMDKGNWGIMKTLYVVQYSDLKTGKLLEKPKVHTYIVNRKEDKLAAPNVTHEIGSNGSLNLSWSPVENASEYYIIASKYSDYSQNRDGSNIKEYHSIIGKTKDTKWSSIQDKDKTLVNSEFKDLYKKSEDEIYRNLEKNVTNSIEKQKEFKNLSNIKVIASNGSDYSTFSNDINFSDIVGNMPSSIALYTWEKEVPNAGRIFSYENISNIPTNVPVTMCDGKTKFLPVEIDLENVKPGKKQGLVVPIKITGTPFKEKLYIKNASSNYEEELKQLNEKLSKNIASGSIKDFSIEEKVNIALESKVVSNKIPKIKDDVFATTPLGYYIASNLIDNVDVIDLSEFPEANDRNILFDTIREVTYQNPTIQMVKKFDLSSDGKYLGITYFEADRNKRIAKQDEIREKLNKVAEDIKASTSDPLEQTRKINSYVCENGNYDFEALESLEKSVKDNSSGIDPKYENSFSTYGISVQNKGVCISYAHTFNYIAKKVGLDGIVVTGNINGIADIGHAWNAIKINGEWKYFDSTWNDENPDGRELYFNLKMDDPIFSKTHNLDERYILKNKIENYINK